MCPFSVHTASQSMPKADPQTPWREASWIHIIENITLLIFCVIFKDELLKFKTKADGQALGKLDTRRVRLFKKRQVIARQVIARQVIA